MLSLKRTVDSYSRWVCDGTYTPVHWALITDVYIDIGTLPNFDLSPDTLLQKFAKYVQIQKISPSKFKTQTRNAKKTLRWIVPPNISPGSLYLEIALKYKMKQSKNGAVTHKFLHLPENYHECKMIAVKKFHSLLLVA